MPDPTDAAETLLSRIYDVVVIYAPPSFRRALWRPFAFLFKMGRTADEPGAVSTKRKSSIYRRGVSVPTTAKVRRGGEDAVN